MAKPKRWDRVVGRPTKMSVKAFKELAAKFEAYIDENQVPIISEFAYQNHILKQQLYDWPEFANLLKRCKEKKEAQLEKAALANKVNVSMAIFSLKQLGWTDKQDINMTTQYDEAEIDKRIQELQEKDAKAE